MEHVESSENNFYQWVADNVDHNLVTLTGKGTFHGMGVISISSTNTSNATVIKRLKERRKAEDFVRNRGIPIENYLGKSYKGLLNLKFKPINQLEIVESLSSEVSYNLLWQCNWFFSLSTTPQPNWSVFMQEMTHSYSTQRKGSIKFLPIIDLNPSDENCIFSTLLFIIDQAKKFKVETPCVTFDQPLWLKATGIIEEAKLNIFCRLGGFHTTMSFLGSIGELMKGSGLENLFAEVYAEHSVKHMISGKAISRALRAHHLVEIALTSLLINMLIEKELIDVTVIQSLLTGVLESPTKEKNEVLINSEVLKEVSEAISDLKKSLSESSRTAKLWLTYLDYINVLKQFIMTERTSNWSLHIQSTLDMLNLFAVTGHINYTKCARFYGSVFFGCTKNNNMDFEKKTFFGHKIFKPLPIGLKY